MNGCFMEFHLIMRSEDLCKSKKYQYRVSSWSGSNEKALSSFEIIDRLKIVKDVAIQNVPELLSKNGSLILTLQVEIGYWTDPVSQHERLFKTKLNQKLVNQYFNLLNDATFSDFTFVVKGRSFRVHKSILASESEIMRAMFTTHFKESVHGECQVDDIEPDIFQYMLQFVYAGLIPENLDYVSMDLYKAAHYYRIEKLMDRCKENIRFILAVSNAIEIYELSALYDIEDIKVDAWKIVKL